MRRSEPRFGKDGDVDAKPNADDSAGGGQADSSTRRPDGLAEPTVSWLRQAVREDLGGAHSTVKLRQRLVNAWRDPDSRSSVALLTIGPSTTVLLVSAILSWIDRSLLPGLAPSDPGAALATLWGVYSGVVALAVPLLILAIELPRDHGLIAVRRTQVLLAETHALQVAYIALPFTVSFGIGASYLQDDSVMLINLLTFGVVLCLILWAYSRAIRLLTSPTLLDDSARSLLLRRLDRAVTNEFVERAANDRLQQLLPEIRFATISQQVTRIIQHDLQVPAPSSGWVEDINAHLLEGALRDLQAPQGSRATSIDQDTPTSEDAGSRRIVVYLSYIGDRVSTGQALLAVEGLDDPPGRDTILRLQSAFRIDSDA